MKVLTEEFWDQLASHVPFNQKVVAEIGCGNGLRTWELIRRGAYVFGIDPSREDIDIARNRNLQRAHFSVASGTHTKLGDTHFDVVIFTLSLHHVPKNEMILAIDEALRIVKPEGFVVFIEPSHLGSFLAAEVYFEAGDGNETKQKIHAFEAMTHHPGLNHVDILTGETIFFFESADDFTNELKPKVNLGDIDRFLRKHDFHLVAERRINICRPK